MPVLFYRYVGDREKESIERNNVIRSRSGKTYFTTEAYDTAEEARGCLALPDLPSWRIGPVPADEMPDFDAVPLRAATRQYGQPGNGIEGATSRPVYLFGFTRLR